MVMWLIAANVALLVMVLFFYLKQEGLVAFAFLCMIGCGVCSCSESDWYKKSEHESELEAQKRATPHVIREVDGCKVYAFETDREHYFTRCGSTVTTETNWKEYCGKACWKDKSDTITTEGNK